MHIKVIYKQSYGRDLFFPADLWAEQFLHFIRPFRPPASFSAQQIQQLQQLGFTIDVEVAKPVGFK